MAEISLPLEIDDRILCPIDQTKVCPARARIVQLYSENIGEDTFDMPDSFSPALDSAKMGIRLAEHTAQAMVRRCTTGPGEACSVWADMKNDPKREAAIKGLRRLGRFWSK
jgi:hypothetical protein